MPGPFDGGWDGASGMRDCRITDLNLGGCFIDVCTSSPIGTRLTTEVRLAGQAFRLSSEVVFVDRVQGFAVRFLHADLALLRELAAALAATQSATSGRIIGRCQPPSSS